MSNLSNRAELERQVLAAVIVFLKERAAATGRDHWYHGRELQAAFPGIPQSVEIDACLVIDAEQTEAWWDGLAKTIEGEIVKNALAKNQPAKAE